jgi:cyclopropane fatty-acyl-phospholipid synthase-like methyltransferase
MSNIYLKKNIKFWDRTYHSPNVESFVFRMKSKLLDKYFKNKVSLLDYGCGEGANLKYFDNLQNFDCYGVDTCAKSIAVAKKRGLNVKKINGNTSIVNIFPEKHFNLIISIQVLYYLDKISLEKKLLEFKKLLKKKGLVFFTMIGTKNKYFTEFSEKKRDKNNMTIINLKKNKSYFNDFKKRYKQKNHEHFINFTKNEKELINKFKMFKKLNVGYYDGSLYSLNDSGFHYTFFGQNK